VAVRSAHDSGGIICHPETGNQEIEDRIIIGAIISVTGKVRETSDPEVAEIVRPDFTVIYAVHRFRIMEMIIRCVRDAWCP